MNKAVTNQTDCTVELSSYTKSRLSYDVSITICPVLDSQGKLTSWISIQRDITDKKKYVEEIEHQNKRLKDIRWLQSHGVRAPLTRIMSLVDLLETKNVKAERLELMKYLRISANELDEIVTLIANQTPTEFSLNRS